MIPVKYLTSPDYGQLKDKQHMLLQDVTSAHVQSFNTFCLEGLDDIVKHMEPYEFCLKEGDDETEPLRLALEIKSLNPGHIGLEVPALPIQSVTSLDMDVNDSLIRNHYDAFTKLNSQKIRVQCPLVSGMNRYVGNSKLYPAECRQRSGNYSGNVEITVAFACSNGQAGVFDRFIGAVPIMVKSALCNIATMKPAELVKKGEEAEEMGGYFIVNGFEKVIRLIIQQRRNYPYCLRRKSWKSRGSEYTEYGVCIRCVREDQTINNLTLHYLQSGTVKLAVGIGRELFFIPLVIVLKGLFDVSDKTIYDALIQGREDDTFYKSCIVHMLRQVMNEGFNSQLSVLRHIGKTFRVKLELPSWYSDEAVGKYVYKHSICIHLDDNKDKFNLLVFMTKKLFALVNGECAAEDPDNPMLHEVLLPGQLIQMLLTEKLESWLKNSKSSIMKVVQNKKRPFQGTAGEIKEGFRYVPSITKALQYLLSTGNLISNTGLGLSQRTGLAIVGDKLNFARYISHFRAIHRGAFFTEMRTTSVRKLLPEAWGFLCPVHTPDGTPCGLLNHLSANCKIITTSFPFENLRTVLIELGVFPVSSPILWPLSDCYTVILDGCVIGYVNAWSVDGLVSTLRILKVKGRGEVPFSLEICLVKKTEVASLYPAVYLFSTVTRMVRPVLNVNANAVEMIGTFEQVYLNIALNNKESEPGVTTHEELSEHGILSVVASMTPYSDFNQSPRNMYQCQMGKQTMGFPLHSYDHRGDNKLYRLETPQSPLVRPKMYDTYSMDEYPLGTNTVVAVISYTGYDMEDAMILNKGSHERGFTHGCIIKAMNIDLTEVDEDKKAVVFCRDPNDTTVDLDPDGLPAVGTKLTKGDPFYSYFNVNTSEYTLKSYTGTEDAYVLQIKILGDELGEKEMNNVCFMLRIERNPTIGDKFSSRHGQKGICSMLWPVEDMPFTESGMVPDIIFNPHGFPSRMTIGMMIESMAGKSGALHGMFLDATPFMFSEDQPAIDYYGQILTAGGYNYHGTERLYSGITGKEMEADIYVGIIYYQRLRHMVSDKFQVRTTGPVSQLTQQPLKGRRRGGGIRFGEMERDALITHGSSFLLQDRLFNCSDKSEAFICTTCKSIISPLFVRHAEGDSKSLNAKFQHQTVCQHCKKRENIHLLSVPFVFRYMTAELASVGIKVSIDVKKNKC